MKFMGYERLSNLHLQMKWKRSKPQGGVNHCSADHQENRDDLHNASNEKLGVGPLGSASFAGVTASVDGLSQ
jgi:hypothetical protein